MPTALITTPPCSAQMRPPSTQGRAPEITRPLRDGVGDNVDGTEGPSALLHYSELPLGQEN